MNTNHHPPRILIFDSGVGGLSVMQEIRQRLPNCQFFYASDNAAFPYGTKTEEDLIARVDRVLHQLLAYIEQHYHPVDIIIVACNTASTLTLPHIRSRFTQPIVGVVPAIKPAAERSTTKVIGLLATPATIARPYTLNLIKEYASDCAIISVGSSELVEIAERKLRGETISLDAIKKITAPFQESIHNRQLDTLILACTHFPLMRTELSLCMSNNVQFIDSGEAIARRVEFLLNEHKQLTIARNINQQNNNLALFTKATADVEKLRQALMKYSLGKLHFVET